MAINEPFVAQFRQNKIHKHIEKQQQENIMQIFDTLNLDQEEREFIDSKPDFVNSGQVVKDKQGSSSHILETNFDDELD